MIRDARDVGTMLNAGVAIVVGFVGFVVNAGLSLPVEMFFWCLAVWGWCAVGRAYVRSLQDETGADPKPAPVL